MTTVGIRELKNQLRYYIQLVERGERVEITDRGDVVAVLCPPSRSELEDLPPGKPNRPDLYPDTGFHFPEGTARRLLDETRGHR